MNLDRRQFLAAGSIAVAAGGTVMTQLQAAEPNGKADKLPLIISTWPFGKPGNEKALATIQAGGSLLDGVEQGIRLVEDSGNQSVGLSGKPNAAGYSQLDACIMHGPGHQAGGVAGIEGILHPITAARRVMEKTKHVLLVGEGAQWFAEQEGLKTVKDAEIEKKKAAHLQKQAAAGPRKGDQLAHDATAGTVDNHDTITILALGADGTISGGCSTSGLAGKMPGRVGDSPIIGSGLYVDNEVGAAGATGVGENVMRYCASFMVVEYMRNGMHPAEACRAVIERIAKKDPQGFDLSINFIAIDKQGRFGAAGTDEFPYSVTYPGFSEVVKVPAIKH